MIEVVIMVVICDARVSRGAGMRTLPSRELLLTRAPHLTMSVQNRKAQLLSLGPRATTTRCMPPLHAVFGEKMDARF